MRAKLALLAVLLLATNTLAQDIIHGRVVGVTDGDTIRVLTAAKQLPRIRVAFVDAPESSQVLVFFFPAGTRTENVYLNLANPR